MDKLIGRVKDILVNPKPTWEVIKADSATVAQIYTGYLLPLAAITPVAMFIGHSLIGFRVGLFTSHLPIGSGLLTAVLSYVLTLVGVFIAATVIDGLAPTFGATRNRVSAFKVAAYAWTPGFVAGVLNILPALSVLVLLASLYGIYLLYLGLQSLMACPREKAVGYTIVSILVMVAVYIVIGLVVGAVSAAGMGMRPGMNMSPASVTIEREEGKATYIAGGGAQVPKDFPKDVYVYAGATLQGVTTAPNSWNLILQTKDSAEKVRSDVEAKMTDSGWKEVMTHSVASGQSMVTYKKEGRTAAVVIDSSGKMTQIVVTVAQE